jgi:predicted phosphohydrolase
MSTPIRLLTLSDLHLEFGTFLPPSPDLYDIAVLAGDIAVGAKAVHWAQRLSTFACKPVVLVAGNHEFYGSERTRMLTELRQAAVDSNVHLLDRDEVTLLGVRFLGTTLWTDFELDVAEGTDVDQAMRDATLGLNDFTGAIRERQTDSHSTRHFTPRDAAREHVLSRSWLRARLRDPVPADVTATVVVTHHGPSRRSMDPIYEGSELNPCFYSDLPESFFHLAALWVHGHTHSSSDYRHHRTRIVANPRGYTRRNGTVENASFNPGLVISLPGAEVGSGAHHE